MKHSYEQSNSSHFVHCLLRRASSLLALTHFFTDTKRIFGATDNVVLDNCSSVCNMCKVALKVFSPSCIFHVI